MTWENDLLDSFDRLKHVFSDRDISNLYHLLLYQSKKEQDQSRIERILFALPLYEKEYKKRCKPKIYKLEKMGYEVIR